MSALFFPSGLWLLPGKRLRQTTRGMFEEVSSVNIVRCVEGKGKIKPGILVSLRLYLAVL